MREREPDEPVSVLESPAYILGVLGFLVFFGVFPLDVPGWGEEVPLDVPGLAAFGSTAFATLFMAPIINKNIVS